MSSCKYDELEALDVDTSKDSDDAVWNDTKPTKTTSSTDDLCLAKLRAQCVAAKHYPRNIAEQGYARYQLDSKYAWLQEQSTRLSCTQDRASVVFYDFSKDAKDFWPIWITSLEALKVHLGLDPATLRRDPWCRYLFISAPPPRDRFSITHEMLTLCCTYLQIMPEFIDLLMIFGKQSRPLQSHQVSFRNRTRLSDNGFKKSSPGLAPPDLGWSGRDLQLCYNLKSVERYSQEDWPWSICDCVVNQSFDVEFVRITWLIIKGDSLVQNRIRSATTDPNTAEMSSFQTLGKAFASTLATHLLLAEWAAENWDQYCVFVEARLYAITGGILRGQKEFAVSDLQELQYIYDKINEALLVLELDANNLHDLLQYYETILGHTKFPEEIIQDSMKEFEIFRSELTSHITHLHNSKLRFRTLAKNISNSRKLLHKILAFQKIQRSKTLTNYSSASNINIESMAIELHDIAQKTKTGTVCMKVITLVTLVFLPAIFSSTLMSTPIFQFQRNNPSNSTSPDPDPYPYQTLTPLQMYLAITLPLTAATFCVWIFFHYCEKAWRRRS